MSLEYGRRLWLVGRTMLVLALGACAGSSGAPSGVAPSEVASTTAQSSFASLPQSRTAEGYYVLGQPDAPLTIEFFSDFL
jgi:hypothetical protein